MHKTDIVEIAFAECLQLIAIGEEREATRGHLIDTYQVLSVDEINDVLADALRDALKQGIEREDIDPSWF